MSGNYTFKWPKGPQEVIVTGEFDNWQKSLPLVKQADGSFELSVPLAASHDKVLYKYVVDGEWLVSSTQAITKDESGNENNYVTKEDFTTSAVSGSKIPEAGGLAVPAVAATAAGTAAAAATTASKDVKATVMPTQETEHTQQKTLGEPGIFVPKDAEQLKAFETVRDVDPKTLNEPELSAEEKKKLKKKVKRTQYKAKKKKANGASGEGDSTDVTPEPESDLATSAAAAALAKGPDAIEKEAEAKPEAEKSTSAAGIATGAAVAGATAIAAGLASGTSKTASAVEKSVDPLTTSAPATTETPAVAATEAPAVAATEAHAEPVAESADALKTLDPKVEQEETEVSAIPVKPVADATAAAEDEEEIVIARGDVTQKELADKIHAKEGNDVTVEEFKPTEAEAKKLAKEATTATKKAAAAPAATASAAKTKAATATKETKNKKENIFKRFLKKLVE